MKTIRAYLSNGIIFPLEKIDFKKLKNSTIRIEFVEQDELSKKEKREQLEKVFREIHKTNSSKTIYERPESKSEMGEDNELLS